MADDNLPPSGSFLGTGWSFPPEFVVDGPPGQEAGRVTMTSDDADIRASLFLLFHTQMGERFLQPTYGLDMQELLFDSVSTTMRTLLEDRIRTTVLVFEPRINQVVVQVDTSEYLQGRFLIQIEYAIRTTNSRYNLVVPFALNEGNEVRALLGQGV
jgi:phage baseplate assembly protein W